MFVLAGLLKNILSRGTVTSSSASSLFPLASLWNEFPSSVFKFNAAAADDYIECDGDIVQDGDFEDGIDGWTEDCVGGGNTTSLEETLFDTGSKALKLTLAAHGSGAYYASRYKDLQCRAGERLNFSVRLRGDGVVSARLRLYIVEAGLYLDSDLTTWTTSAVDVDSVSAAGYASHTGQITLPGMSTLRLPEVTLRLSVVAQESASTGAAYADNIFLWPSWNFVSVHGHNLGPVAMELRESTDAFGASDVLVKSLASTALVHPSFHWYEDTPCDLRYMRLLLSGTNYAAGMLGEVVVGQALSCATMPDRSYESTHGFPGSDSTSPSGVQFPVSTSDKELRELNMRFQFATEEDLLEFRDEVVTRSKAGRIKLVVVPDDSLTRPLVVFGKMAGDRFSVTSGDSLTWSGAFEVLEDAFPVSVS